MKYSKNNQTNSHLGFGLTCTRIISLFDAEERSLQLYLPASAKAALLFSSTVVFVISSLLVTKLMAMSCIPSPSLTSFLAQNTCVAISA